LRLAIVGSRTFKNFKRFKEILDKLRGNGLKVSRITSGGAIGADSLAEKYAKQNDIPLHIYKPDWDKYGKRAGFIRNHEIVDNSDFLIAFWNGVSKGTQHSIMLAEQKQIDYRIFYV
jgi:hypothetical protein